MSTKIISTSDGVFNGLATTFRKHFSINQKLVTNTDVKNKFVNIMASYLGSGYGKIILKLVEKGSIIPVECTNDFIKALNKNLKGDACMNPKEYENVLGFYTGRQNRLYILMDNIQRLMGGSNKAIKDVTIHELQHMSCYNVISEFINTWSNELCHFYAYFLALVYKSYTSGLRTLWNSITGKDKEVIQKLMDPDNGVKYLIQYLIYNHEYLYCCAGSSISTGDCKAIGEKYSMVLINNGCDQNIADSIAKAIYKMSYDIFDGKIGSTYKSQENSNIIECFRQAYLKTFGKDPWKDNTFIYQELIFPSEVISITSQYFSKNSKYYKFLNYL